MLYANAFCSVFQSEFWLKNLGLSWLSRNPPSMLESLNFWFCNSYGVDTKLSLTSSYTHSLYSIMNISHRLLLLESIEQFIIHWIAQYWVQWPLILWHIVRITIEYFANTKYTCWTWIFWPEIFWDLKKVLWWSRYFYVIHNICSAESLNTYFWCGVNTYAIKAILLNSVLYPGLKSWTDKTVALIQVRQIS